MATPDPPGTKTTRTDLSLQPADDQLDPLQLLALLQQALLQLLHPQLGVGPQLLLQAQLCRGLGGHLHSVPELGGEGGAENTATPSHTLESPKGPKHQSYHNIG